MTEKTEDKVIAVLGAIREWLMATEDERSAFRDYDGYEWGYYGHQYISRVEQAEEKAIASFKSLLGGLE